MKKLIILIITILFSQNTSSDDKVPGFLYEVNPEKDCPILYQKNEKDNLSIFSCETGWAQCQGEALKRYDRELNLVYQELIASYEKEDRENSHKTQLVKQLKEAESAWVKFRDAQCRVVYFSFYGGNSAPRRETVCHLTLTKNRLEELKKFQTGNL